MQIEAITIKKFRGASTLLPLRFEKDKPLIVIFGENATGKTTIVDALDFVCNEVYGSLEDRSSTLPKKHLPSIGSKASDLEVVLEADGKSWTAQLDNAGPRTVGPPGRPLLYVLRRSKILRIVNEQPKRRYEALADLLGLPGIRQSEDNLREALKDRETRYEEAVRAKTQADEALEKLWEAEGRPGKTALEWGRGRAAASETSLVASLTERKTLSSLFERAEAAFIDLGVTREQYEAVTATRAAADEELSKAEMAADVTSPAFVGLLVDAERALSAGGDPTECPLCESRERVSGLASRVKVRLAGLSHLVDLRRKANEARIAEERARGALERAGTTFVAVVRESALQSKSASVFSELAGAFDWSGYPALLEAGGNPSAADEAERLWPNLRPHGPALTASSEADQRALNQLTALRQYATTVDEKTAAAKDLEAVSKALGDVLTIVEGQRKGYVDGLLATVSARAQTMYAKVHPGEELGDVRFFLKPKVMGSLECDGKFEGTPGVPPQAYYSDSHLDTLGICVFLALAQVTAVGGTVVVLDDVLTSADGPHADRFIRMLQDEVTSFEQIIVTTHYRPWRDRFRFRAAAGVQLIDLGSWSLARGVWPLKTKLKVEELRDLLAAGILDRQAVASKAGVFLEELLRFICLRYRCKIAMLLEAKHSLGELAAAITSRLAKALRASNTVAEAATAPPGVELQPLIEDATRWNWVRNQVGAHFDETGLDIPDVDIREFGKACLNLVERLACATCGELPARSRTGSYWECRCALVRMYPLAAPGEPPPPIEE